MGCLLSCFEEIPYYPRLYYDMSPVKEKSLPVIWLIGPPGSGRRSQGEMLADHFGFDNIRITQVLRDEATKDTDRGNLISNAIRNRLKKIPDTLVVDMLKESMLKSVNTTKGYIINNFPKSAKQADLFVNEICNVDIILYLQTDIEVLIERIQQKVNGRIRNSALKMKIDNCNKDIQECLVKYRNKVHEVRMNTNGPPTEAFENIRDTVNNNLSLETVPITSEQDYAESRTPEQQQS